MGLSERRILEAVGRYHYVTSNHMTRLFGWETSPEYSRLILKKLTDSGHLVKANWIDNGVNPGNKERVWSLTTKGRNALRASGVTVAPRLHHISERAQLFMLHTQAVNDVLIACERYVAETDGVDLLEFFHDLDLQRRAVKVQVPGFDKMTNVNQDGLTVFSINGTPDAYGWEIDRGTEQRAQWQAKVLALIAFAGGPYQKAFAQKTFTVAVYVRSHLASVSSGSRARQLVEWTEDALTRANKLQWAPFFAITCEDPAKVEPAFFLRSPHWVSPFERSYKPLLPEVTA